jgi:hypothetical protein
MLDIASASDEIIAKIRLDAGAWDAARLLDVLRAGRRQRPADYDGIVRGLAVRYAGDQQSVVRQALRRVYPQTADRLPVDPVNWLRFFARQDSGVYRDPAQRRLVDESGEQLDVGDPRAVALSRALDEIGIDGLMAEAERRANTGARAVVVVVGARRIGDSTKLTAHLYWPHDVVTITHESAPDDVDAVYVVCLRQASSSAASPVWWVWTREPSVDDDGVLSFGPWSHRRVSEDGKIATPSIAYDGVLPIAILRTEPPSGGLWPEPDRDVIVNVDSLNVARANRQHVVNMQAHAQLVYSGIMRETSQLVGGPDTVLQVGAGETLQYLVPGADHDAIEASATRDLQELGVSRGNSPDAYAVEPGAPQSGVSRLIANAPHDARIAEARPIYQRFEEQHLLPVVIDVVARFVDGAPSSFDGVRPRVTLATSKPYEDDAAKAERVLALKAAGLVDESDARVMLGLSADRAEAEAYLASTRGPRMPVGVLTGSPFTVPRETTTTGER